MNIKVADIISITVYPEICCEKCNEVIHNHIDCPVCNTVCAETDTYHDLEEFSDKTVKCDVCGAIFELADKKWYSIGHTIVKVIKLKS